VAIRAVTLADTTPNVLITRRFACGHDEGLVSSPKKNPGKFHCSSGTGSSDHSYGGSVQAGAGSPLHVPYKGGVPARPNHGKQIDIFVQTSAPSQLIKAGKMKALAVTATARNRRFRSADRRGGRISRTCGDSWQAAAVPAKTR